MLCPLTRKTLLKEVVTIAFFANKLQYKQEVWPPGLADTVIPAGH